MKRRDFITRAGLGTAAIAGASLAAPAIAHAARPRAIPYAGAIAAAGPNFEAARPDMEAGAQGRL